ncbi:MAG: hypothetical protein WC659_02765 [Patescibacteria group bacterium]
MNKNFIKILLGLSLCGCVAGYILWFPEKFGVCAPQDRFSCIYPLSERIGQPLLILMSGLSIVSFILLFLPIVIYPVWKKFVFIISPLVLLWVIFTPVQCSGLLGACFDKKLTSLVSTVIFIIGSLTVFIIKYISIIREKRRDMDV